MTDRELYFRLFQLDADGNGIHVKTNRYARRQTITITTLYPDPETLIEVWKLCEEWMNPYE